MKTHNPNCHHHFCKQEDGEVRCLPVTDSGEAVVYLCYECFKREMKERKEFNKECGERVWKLNKWNDLEVVDVA